MTIDLDIHLQDLDTKKTHRLTHWQEYTLISDLMNPADTFSATLAAVDSQRDFTAHGGQKCQVFFKGALQSTAITDERSEAVSGSATDLQISGRGVGGLLMDSVVAPDQLRLTEKTLFQVAQDITAPWQPDYITSVVTNNAANRYMVAGKNPSYSTGTKYRTIWLDANGKDSPVNTGNGSRHEIVKTKIQVKGTKQKFGENSPEYRGIDTDSLKQTEIGPEEKVWEVLLRLCKQIACMPIVGSDGALILTRPAYDFDPSVYGDGIVQKWDRKNKRAAGGNVMRSQFETTIAGRNSEIVAWSTGKATKTTVGKQLLKHVWSVKDPSPAFWKRQAAAPYLTDNILYKPTRVVFRNLRNEKLIRRKCRGMFEERVIGAFSLEYQLKGHTINGVMPVVDSMISVYDERYGLIGQPYYITRVERKLGLSDGATTVLKLIPPKIWLYFDHDKTPDSEYLEHMVQRVFW
jgi:prophage tail gpP-like protein